MNRHRIKVDVWSAVRSVVGSSSMRLAFAIAGLFAITITLAGVISFVTLSRDLNTRLESQARQIAENLAVTYQFSGLRELQAQIATNAATTRDHSNLYLFVDRTGSTVFGNFNTVHTFTGVKTLVSGVDIELPDQSGSRRQKVFIGYGLRIPAGWIITARETKWVTDTKNFLLRAALWGLGVALVLSVSVAVYLARRSEGRIDQLYQVLENAAAGNLTARYRDETRWNDDIGRVAATVNTTLDRLSLTVDSLRQVSNDVAHDLRTPLSRLQTRIEPLLDRNDLPADARDAVLSAESDIDGIVKTFNAILRIAQIEGRNIRRAEAAVDLTDVAASVHEMLVPVAEDTGHKFDLRTPKTPLLVQGDRELLAQAIVNLVENAIRYCQSPSKIVLTVAPKTGGVRISVCDNGPGIPEAEHKNVLRRFYRLERSRNSDGSGLGLCLVAAISHLHGGTVTLSDNAPGLCVTLDLPVHPDNRVHPVG